MSFPNQHYNHHFAPRNMFNMQRCPWQGPNGGYGNQQMFRNGGPFFRQPPPRLPHQNNMVPPYGPGFMWQGPGMQRPRGRGYRQFRGSHNQWMNRREDQNNTEAIKDCCCKCGERLQNSNEPGIHLCDGGNEVQIQEIAVHEDSIQDASDAEVEEAPEEDLDARLEKLLLNLKDCMRDKYKTVTEALEGYVTDKIDEISTLHRENLEQKEVLEKLKKELEEKAEVLLQQETELREKQKKLCKDKETFKRDMKREKEEVCRQWQQLRDEITRMEELHKTQQGRVKLDVGGNVFTTSFLTLTRESDSMLAAMFSGRHEIKKEEDGSVFIDRDGTHFRYVLNYLRDGGMNIDSLPKDRQLLKELRKEATYYQLHGLLQQIEKCLY